MSIGRLPGGGQSPIWTAKGELKAAYRPPLGVRQDWQREAGRRGDPAYERTWDRFWRQVVAAAWAFGAVGATDMAWVDEYVRHCRLAELHNREAQRDPYFVADSGYTQAHPGFTLARSEAMAARATAAEMGLTPRLRREAGIEVPRPEAPPDDQTGPDGEAL